MRPVLPGKDELLMACRGFPLPADDPVLSAAAELAVLHQRREQTAWEALAVIDAHRARLMDTIDTWVQVVIPEPASGARVHTQTMGQVIDRLAELTAHTYTALAGASEEVFWDSAEVVDDLAIAYADLVEELLAGTRRLPMTTTSV
ncbi:DUF4254 domain-containing protein [Nocardia sputi]|uniref:DUF4254 domain-containing protein n=1 Tax=Nocardia sputi TaxID=2943705 RepID=UPI0020C10EEE|nr:DUF4254 domain-containing protein [Nocardia sputi]